MLSDISPLGMICSKLKVDVSIWNDLGAHFRERKDVRMMMSVTRNFRHFCNIKSPCANAVFLIMIG